MGSDSLLVMTMALAPGVLATGLWCFVRQRNDELRDCLALASPRPER